MKKLIAIAYSAFVVSTCVSQDELDAFVSGSGPVEYVAGTNVVAVRPYAFADNRTIRSITIPNAKSSGSAAFIGCSSLEVVRLPEVLSVSRFAGIFSGCMSLREVHLESVVFSAAQMRQTGFPWGTTSRDVVFYFSNGKFDREGNKRD